MFTKKLLKKGVVATVAAGGLLFAIAGPASAATAGTGAGTGWEYSESINDCFPPIPPTPLGAEISDARFELSHQGTYVGAPSSTGLPAVAYVGPSRVSIEITENHVAGPLGTHSGNCNGSSYPLPALIPIAEVSIEGNSTDGGSVECEGAGGTYTRVGVAVAFTFTATCDITSNLGLSTQTNVPVQHVIEGTSAPCILVPPLGQPENPECIAGEVVNPSEGDPGAHLVTAYEAVAVP